MNQFKNVLSIMFIMVSLFSIADADAPGWEWAKGCGISDVAGATGIAVDDQGNTYVLGTFQGSSITFGSTTLMNTGDWSDFIVIYDPSGTIIRTNLISGAGGSGPGAPIVSGIGVDAAHNYYVTGNIQTPSVTFNPSPGAPGLAITLLTPNGYNHIFIVKFNANGSVAWANGESAADGNSESAGIAVDAAGNSYITGTFDNDAIFGGKQLSSSGSNIFVASFNNSGAVQFASGNWFDGAGNDRSTSIATDGSGNCYITGVFNSTYLTFGTNPYLWNGGGYKIFIAKYDNSGNAVWSLGEGGTGGDSYANGIAANISGVCVTGEFSCSQIIFYGTSGPPTPPLTLSGGGGNAFVVKYDQYGKAIWSQGITGSTNGQGVAIDGNGDCYTIGNFQHNDISIGPQTLTWGGGDDNLFTAKYDGATGTPDWAKGTILGRFNEGVGIAVTSLGEASVTGVFNGTVSFDATTLKNSGGDGWAGSKGVFTSKLGAVSVSAVQCSICLGGSTTLTATGATNYMWSPADGLSSTTGSTVIASPPLNRMYTVRGFDGIWSVGQANVTVNVTFPKTLNLGYIDNITYPGCTTVGVNTDGTETGCTVGGNNAQFCIHTTPFSQIIITSVLPASITTKTNQVITLTPYTADWSLPCGRLTTFDPFNPTVITLDASGTVIIRIGVIGNFPPDLFPGTYSGVALVTWSLTGPNAPPKTVEGVADSNQFMINVSATVPPASSVTKGWNMVSVPVTVSDSHKSILYPTASSDAYEFQGSYVIDSLPSNGVGYWLKFGTAQDIAVAGSWLTDDTVSVTPGWNMIGSISEPLPTNRITSVPGGLTTSQFFGYHRHYVTSDTIFPGNGYWVKVDRAGKLVLDTSSSSAVSAVMSKSYNSRIKIMPSSETPPPPPEIQSGDTPAQLPETYVLGQNYPNPFNPTTVINYQLPDESYVRLALYNVLGQEVRLLVNQPEQAGYKSIQFDANNFSSGIYFYRLDATSVNDPSKHFSQTRKMLLIK
ncbi:MAG: T9SS type A sorting domain-containing protein [Bacteroidota bacterium]